MVQRNLLAEKLKEAVAAVAPIALIVAAVCFIFVPVGSGLMLAFLVGAALVIVGMGLFSLGAEISMSRIGSQIGAKMTASRKLWLILLLSFLLGAAITVAEPDLQVLAAYVPGVDTGLLITAVSIGVGLFLTLSMLRILFSIPLRALLIACYALVFLAACFTPSDMLSVAFDSGGVTTGPMTVPFIMAMGVGVASIRSDEHAREDSFGLVALCSVGPILAVMLLGALYRPETASGVETAAAAYDTTTELGHGYLAALPSYLYEVSIALLPIFLFFLGFQLVSLRLRRVPFLRILLGVAYTYIGLVLFLTGVNVGFSPLGYALGSGIAGSGGKWALIPLAMLMGWFIIRAEPAVQILNKQVEELSAGAISEKAMGVSLSVAVAAANGLAMVRVVTGVPILYFLIPGYALALALSFFVPGSFTAIAFDSGGVASGPLTAAFMLPFAMGACGALGGSVMTDAFGLVAMVAMTPLITVQIMGAIFVLRSRTAREPALSGFGDNDIIELWEVA